MRFIIALTLILMVGCNSKNKSTDPNSNKPGVQEEQEYEPIPYTLESVDEINQIIKEQKLQDLESIAKSYYLPDMTGEGDELYTIFTESKKVPPRVTVLHDNIPDDSLRGIKYTILVNDGNVSEIRKSVRCWPGRGPGYWNGNGCR